MEDVIKSNCFRYWQWMTASQSRSIISLALMALFVLVSAALDLLGLHALNIALDLLIMLAVVIALTRK